jgi:ribosomal protein S18 acetylase RimI-like enzyme
VTADHALVRRLERAAFRAWPAREEIRIGGWLVRFAGGHTGRANSVNPMGSVSGDLRERVRECEELFRARHLRPLFRATPLLEPSELVSVLQGERYVLRSPTRVMTADLTGRPARAPAAALELTDRVEDAWFERIVTWTDLAAERRDALRWILDAIRRPRACATVHDDEGPVAGGLAVRDAEWVGLFDLVTDPERRGRGHGTRLAEGLLGWGVARGARRAYLQVEEGNEAARRLYRRLGFEDAYAYAYWVSGEESPYQLPKSVG